VYEFAKNIGLSSKEVLELLAKGGFVAQSHMSVLSEKEQSFLEKQLSKKDLAKTKQNVAKKDVVAKEAVKETRVKKGATTVKTAKSELKVEDSAQGASNLYENAKKGEKIDIAKTASTAKNTALTRRSRLKNSAQQDVAKESTVVAEPEELEEIVVVKKPLVVEELDEFLEDGSVYSYPPEHGGVVPNVNKKLRPDVVGNIPLVRNKRRQKNQVGHREKNEDVHEATSAMLPQEIRLDLSRHYSVIELAKVVGMSPAQMVGFFVKRGKFYSANNVVPPQDIEAYASDWGVIVKKVDDEREPKMSSAASERIAATPEMAKATYIKRPPVVVVLGHVDHGKTTLIDYIRKTNVAAKEKGGITQSVRIYKVKVADGELLLIDTPGHEAFSSMRQVGAQITDIAVIIVAADDGVMPQTVESIAVAKEMGATIVVAINKIDKPGVEGNIDKIKQRLASHDILVEDWGGQVVCLPISAKTGKGVVDLLEMIWLQAEIMSLRATADLNAKAFVLESFVERGQGPCAVVISKQGILRVGDDFVVDGVAGRVKAMFDLNGRLIKQLLPYEAAKVVGLVSVAKTGAFLEYFPRAMLAKFKNAVSVNLLMEEQVVALPDAAHNADRVPLKIILKADGYGTAAGLTKAIKLMLEKNVKFKGMVSVVATSIGNIYEKDILAAVENDAVIFGMNVILEKNAAELARQNKVLVMIDSIIYRLVEQVEELIIAKLKSIKELKQIGKGFVKKVFDIKGRGVIAGCAVTDGTFVDKAIVHCFRDNIKVGEARIVSLQQDRKIMKEVVMGQDCGILCQGFTGWQEGDKVFCFSEVSLY